MDSNQLKQLTEQVKTVAREAGKYIRQQALTFTADRIEAKGAHDYVSYVDKAAERLIVDHLEPLLPGAGFLTEEKTTANDTTHPYTWVIDPLDGTTNFVHGLAPYCVAIALRSQHDTLIGVVYEVTADELFWTHLGGKAYRDDVEISVSSTGRLTDALCCFGFPYNADEWSPVMQRLVARYYGRCASIRNLGSAAAELCYVACGRLDVYIESYLKPWDVLAGALILRQAGGIVTDHQGTSRWTDGSELLATNGLLHQETTDTLRNLNTNNL